MIRIRKADLQRLADWARAAYPHEACALLVGRWRPGAVLDLTRLAQSRNLSPDPARAFEIDLGLRIGLERELRDRAAAADGRQAGPAERLVGLWHSHPDGPALPSERDRAAVQEDLAWLVTAVENGDSLPTRAFRPVPGPGFARARRQEIGGRTVGGFGPVAGFLEERLVAIGADAGPFVRHDPTRGNLQ